MYRSIRAPRLDLPESRALPLNLDPEGVAGGAGPQGLVLWRVWSILHNVDTQLIPLCR